MNDGLIGILGGLIGSILTVVITKIIELIQKKNEFNYELKKQFFAKKLLAAEAAIIQYSNLSVGINQLIILFSKYKESQSDVGQNLNDNLLKQLDELIVTNNSSLELSKSIDLYFDLKTNFSANEVLANFYDNLFMLGTYTENVEITHQQYLSFIGTDDENEAFNIYQNAENFLDQAMKNVAQGYKTFDNELRTQMNQIRTEMKKYD